ncbi:MAG TPA: DNA repair protein RecO [Candidatus Binataceae bacterium]|jgi:DNA repair protein RecO (recombination protein O)
MALEESTPAIVLRARDYAESDRIVTLLTRDVGKISGIAKGAKSSRRRFERKLEPFSHVMLYFRRRPHGDLVFITRAESGGLPPHNIDSDLKKIALGSYMLELVDAFTREEAEAAQAYTIICDGLCAMTQRAATSSLRQAFELKLLAWSGYALEFAQCRLCGRKPGPETTSVAFVVAEGGIVCRACRQNLAAPTIAVSLSSAAAMVRLGAIDLDASVDHEASGLDGASAIAGFLSSVLDRRLRSLEFLESTL